MSSVDHNVDQAEIEKFGDKAGEWWDPAGPLKTLHAVNPIRLAFIRQHAELTGSAAVDVGCGGGILSEALAYAGASVLGIDLASDLVEVASRHAAGANLKLSYRCMAAEALAAEHADGFDLVTCMEMLEHVPDPVSIVESCARLVKPGGMVFFSTLNRNLKSYLQAIVGAEYLLRMIPRGTHQFATFIKPSELAHWSRAAGLEPIAFEGIGYNPLSGQFMPVDSLDVNYLAAFRRNGH